MIQVNDLIDDKIVKSLTEGLVVMKVFMSLSLSFLLSAQSMAQLKVPESNNAIGMKPKLSVVNTGDISLDPAYAKRESAVKSLFSSDQAPSCDLGETFIISKSTEYGFVRSNSLIAGYLSCESFKGRQNKSFNSENCQLAVSCSNSLFKEKYVSEMRTTGLINEMVGKDHIISSLHKYTDMMEDYDVMLKYAAEKYQISPSNDNCESRFQLNPKGASCNRIVLEKTFEDYQSSCSGGSVCFNKASNDMKSYSHFKDTHKNLKVSFMSDYFSQKAEKEYASVKEKDKAYYKKLSDLIKSEHFQKGSDEDKIKAFVEKIGKETAYSNKLNDPILKIVFQDLEFKNQKDIIKDPRAKEFFKFVTSKDLTADNFTEKFDAYRSNLVKNFFGNKRQCKKIPSFQDICSDATKLIAEKGHNAKGLNIANNSVLRFLRDAEFGKELNKILGTELTVEDQDILVYGRKCIAYGHTGLVSQEGKFVNNDVKDDFDDNIYETNSEKTLSKATSSIAKMGGAEELKEEDFSKAIPFDDKNVSAQNQIIAQNPTQANTLPSYMDMYGNSFIDNTEEANKAIQRDKDKVKVEADSAAQATNPNDFLNEKMYSMMKKLADAEAKLQNLKDNQSANGTKGSEVDEASKLEMANLQKEIASLKKSIAADNKNKKEAEALEEAKLANSNSTRNSSNNLSIGKGDSSSSKSGFDSHDGGSRSPSSISGSSNFESGGISRAAAGSSLGAIFSSNNENVTGPRSSLLASGAILTTIEGMAPEIATKTITSKIMELNGEAFLIRQDGLIKEIKPLIRDGKVVLDENGNPVYETIVKGKATDKAFAEVINMNERKPQSIKEVGDLKREQEEKLKRQRAEYIKLQEVLKGVHKPKK